MDRLNLTEADILEIARTGTLSKKSKDIRREGAFVWVIEGRDIGGVRRYMAGKVVRRDGKSTWKVVTIHEARG